MARFKKGSKEAKLYMAHLRSLQRKKRTKGGSMFLPIYLRPAPSPAAIAAKRESKVNPKILKILEKHLQTHGGSIFDTVGSIVPAAFDFTKDMLDKHTTINQWARTRPARGRGGVYSGRGFKHCDLQTHGGMSLDYYKKAFDNEFWRKLQRAKQRAEDIKNGKYKLVRA